MKPKLFKLLFHEDFHLLDLKSSKSVKVQKQTKRSNSQAYYRLISNNSYHFERRKNPLGRRGVWLIWNGTNLVGIPERDALESPFIEIQEIGFVPRAILQNEQFLLNIETGHAEIVKKGEYDLITGLDPFFAATNWFYLKNKTLGMPENFWREKHDIKFWLEPTV